MDNYLLKNSKKDNSFKIFVGGLLIIFSAATLPLYIGYFFLLIALIIFFYNSGIEIDYENDNIRTFFSIFNIKKGDWKGLKNYHSISIKKVHKGHRIMSRSNTSSVESLASFYEVLLMSKKQKDTILLFNAKNKDEALMFAKTMSERINIKIKSYGLK